MRRDHDTTRRAAVVLWALVASLGCSAAPGGDAVRGDTGFPMAYLQDDCAPWDGPALTLMLTHVETADPFDVAYPHLRVTTWRPPARLPGSTLEWSGTGQSEGYATLCESAEACEAAESVRLQFDRVQDRSDTISGDLHVELAGGRVVTGPFEARRIDFLALCG